MPCLQGTKRLQAQGHDWVMEVTADGRGGGGTAGQADLGHRPLTLWDLDGSTAESAQQVGDDVVFDLVLGEPGEHGEQPKHHRFDLG